MKDYTKKYFNYFGIDYDPVTGWHEYIGCEIQGSVCTQEAVDIHHIENRGMGGTKREDSIENLMASCRECHYVYGDDPRYLQELKDKHLITIRNYGLSREHR